MTGIVHQIQEQNKRVIFHEAGHCCAAILLQKAFEYLTVIPKGKYKGYVWGIEESNDLDDALISAAGIYAERIKFNSHHVQNGSQGDFEHIDKILSRIYGPQNLTMAHRQLMDKADSLLRQNWAMVERIAAALEQKKTLSYKEVIELIK